jgi:hypothetical protein
VRRLITAALAAVVATALVSGVLGGLVRAGTALPAALAGPWLAPAAALHAFLMVSCFLGTVIGVERAVALKHPLAFVSPVLSGAAGAAALAGWAAAVWLAFAASVAFVAVNIEVLRRQAAGHTAVLLAAALAWGVGNALFATGAALGPVIAWWFAFLVLTIAAERLELTRLMPRGPATRALLYATLVALVAGAALTSVDSTGGGLLYGAALLALALWLLRNDVARRTLHTTGLSRYMAACLLAGYAWLAVAGVAWAAHALGLPLRDLALHALAIGFVFSMILGHAPVILPAVARVRLRYGPWFYGPLALLHASLALRLLMAFAEPQALRWGALGNALAIVAFAATVAASALAWRRNPAAM